MTISPEFGELIRRAIESRVCDVNVAMPGIVRAYDAAKKTATIEPALQRPIATDDDDLTGEKIPPIENVPVLSLRGARFSIEFPLTPGDTVLLVFNSYSPTEWRTSGAVSTPGDLRPHGVGYPVAIPGYLSDVNAPDFGEENVSLGIPNGLRITWNAESGYVRVGAGDDFVALAAKTALALETLKAAIIAGFGAITAPGGGPAAVTASNGALAAFDSAVAASNLKADVTP